MSYSTAHKVIKDICASNGDPDASKQYVDIARLLSRSLVALKLNIFPSIDAEVFTIGDDLTITLPENAARPIKVGRLLGDGRVRTFGKVEAFSQAAPICSCSSSSSSSASESTVCEACTYHLFSSSVYHRELYNTHTDYFESGKWSLDPKNPGVITLHSGYDVVVGNNVVVQYELVAERDGQQIIPDEFYEIIRAHVLWKYWGARKPNLSAKFHQEMRMEIDQAKRNALKYADEGIVGAMLHHLNS